MKSLNNYIEEKLIVNKDYKSDEQYFIYKLNKKEQIRVFDGEDWAEFNDYKDKVYVNGKKVNLYDDGTTDKTYEPNEYLVHIDDLNKLINCDCMFYDCKQLISVPSLDIRNVKYMSDMFAYCDNLIKIQKLNTKDVVEISAMFIGCMNLEEVPLFNISKVTRIDGMFGYCNNLSDETKLQWSKIYDFDKHNWK